MFQLQSLKIFHRRSYNNMVYAVLILLLAFFLAGSVSAHEQNATRAAGSPYEEWPVIAALEQVGNDADEAVSFTLDGCTNLRMFGMGEGISFGNSSLGNMYDFGYIERSDTGQVIWQMYYFETNPAGGSRNRFTDRTLTLPAGNYRLHFQTNASHAFNDWGNHPPSRAFWGITLYEEMELDRSDPDCWTYAEKPEDLGWSSSQLIALEPELEKLDAAAFMIVTDGQLVYEWGNTANNFFAHSMRKSLLSALYGISVGQGKIDLSKTLAELNIDDKVPLTSTEKQATISDLLKARSGVYIPAAGEAASMKAQRPPRGSHPAGTFWYYNNWDFNALGTIFDQESGQQNIYQAFKDWIADPIKMQDFDLTHLAYEYERQSMHPYYGFRISARDLARFGQLYLQQGEWQGEQIIPADWVTESTTPYSHTQSSGTYSGYGYMWWVAAQNRWAIKAGTYAASGYGGHTLEIFPNLNTVIVVRFNTDDPGVDLRGTDDVERLMIATLRARTDLQLYDPYGMAKISMLVWGVLTALSLLALAWSLAQTRVVFSNPVWPWFVITVVFGPLGLLGFLLLRQRQVSMPSGLRTLAASLRCATSTILGQILLLVWFALVVKEGNVGLLAVVVPFIFSWLFFRTPLLAAWTRRGVGFALSRSLLAELMTTLAVMTGALPVMITLDRQWSPYAMHLDSPLFWAMNLVGAFAGLLAVFPLNLWMVIHRFQVWPFQYIEEGTHLAPSLRNAWSVLLVSLAALVAVIVFIG